MGSNVANGMFSLYMGTAKKTTDKVTLKEYFLDKTEEAQIVLEVSILAGLGSHPNIPNLKELFLTEKAVYIVTDYVDMMRMKNYVDLRNRKSSFTMVETRKIFKALFSAVTHCHEHMVIVRNLTMDNIMIRKRDPAASTGASNGKKSEDVGDYEVKIADFGQAVEFGCKLPVAEHALFDWNQVPYFSPEAVLRLPYNQASDIWSLGVLLFAMVSGELPFAVDDYMDRALLMERIRNAEYSFNSNAAVWMSVKKELRDIITAVFVSDPLNRATAAEIRRNEWFLHG